MAATAPAMAAGGSPTGDERRGAAEGAGDQGGRQGGLELDEQAGAGAVGGRDDEAGRGPRGVSARGRSGGVGAAQEHSDRRAEGRSESPCELVLAHQEGRRAPHEGERPHVVPGRGVERAERIRPDARRVHEGRWAASVQCRSLVARTQSAGMPRRRDHRLPDLVEREPRFERRREQPALPGVGRDDRRIRARRAPRVQFDQRVEARLALRARQIAHEEGAPPGRTTRHISASAPAGEGAWWTIVFRTGRVERAVGRVDALPRRPSGA